ncbi:MAG: hypothetical protein ACE5JM_05150, partial [Armatimonadota bacterium]
VPAGSGANAYRVWPCHGYRESGNDLAGLLRMERRAGDSANSFTLTVHQEIINDGAALNVLDASIACRNNEIASPVRWELSSHFVGLDGKRIDDLAVEETVQVKGGALQVETQGTIAKRGGSRRLSADWCLFEAVQRLPFRNSAVRAFSLLEGLSLLREDHRLSYGGRYPVKLGDAVVSLHWFQQLGHGVLPYDYWLDDRHRLVMVATGPRAYILDEGAEDAFRERVQGSRTYQQQRRQQAAGGTSA